MKKSDIKIAWKNKYKEISGKESGKSRANYLHFDIKPDIKLAFNKVLKPSYIEKHSFWPFIFYKAKAEKIKLLSDLLVKHNLTLPNNLNNKKDLPEEVRQLIKTEPDVSKALISTKGNPHKYAT